MPLQLPGLCWASPVTFAGKDGIIMTQIVMILCYNGLVQPGVNSFPVWPVPSPLRRLEIVLLGRFCARRQPSG